VKRRYVTADVFTDQMFGGNPLAVILDAEGLSTTQMQAIALEFNYSETTFVFPPDDPRHTAKVRIFTPRTEVPFAGHPNVGTAFLLARERRFDTVASAGTFVFEETAGLVPIRLLREGGLTVGAELRAPESLSRRTIVDRDAAATCLSLSPSDVTTARHAPQIVSVGLPFLVVELASRDSLSRAKPSLSAYSELLPLDGADAIFAYWQAATGLASAEETILHARMFSPLDGIVEDPATGSAGAATVALLATLNRSDDPQRFWRIHQGVDMGRPSLLLARTATRDEIVVETHVGGRCVPVLEGSFFLDGALAAVGGS
jgi:trans-2,3-dihydro-3-hydroxyanthranilate isomerase